MKVTYLDEPAFQATFVEPIQSVENDVDPVLDFWPYFAAIPPEDFNGHDCSAGLVDSVYRMSDRFEHVMVRSNTKNVFMTIVIDLRDESVAGHRLMDFNELYGLETPSPP